MDENILSRILIWEQLKQNYLEEIEMGRDIKLNTFLAENAQKEIDKLKSQA